MKPFLKALGLQCVYLVSCEYLRKSQMHDGGNLSLNVRVGFSVHRLSHRAAAHVSLRIKNVEISLCLAGQRMSFRIGRNQVYLWHC